MLVTILQCNTVQFNIMPLPHAAEIGAITSTLDSPCQFFMPIHDVIDCFRVPKAGNIRSCASAQKKLAPESGVKFMPVAPIFGVCVRGLKYISTTRMKVHFVVVKYLNYYKLNYYMSS